MRRFATTGLGGGLDWGFGWGVWIRGLDWWFGLVAWIGGLDLNPIIIVEGRWVLF